MKLIGMTDFVLDQELKLRNNFNYDNRDALVKIFNYANFLKQPLELWMFVPCDEDGNVLEEPFEDNLYDIQEYQQAKERCLFEGFRFVNNSVVLKELLLIPISHFNNNTIEDLVNNYNYIQLTKTAEKLIGL